MNPTCFAVFNDNAEAEDVAMQLSCDTDSINSRTAQITQRRYEASTAQKEQAERMMKRSRVDLQDELSATMLQLISLRLIEAEVINETF